jgi:hypothetical protein
MRVVRGTVTLGRAVRRAIAYTRDALRFERELDAPRCAICGEPIDAGRVRYSRAFRSLVDHVCIPAAIRRRGPAATARYLATGEPDSRYPEPETQRRQL